MHYWSANPVAMSGKYKIYDLAYGDVYEAWVDAGEPVTGECLFYGPVETVRVPQVYREVATGHLWVKEGDVLRSTLDTNLVVWGDLRGFEKL